MLRKLMLVATIMLITAGTAVGGEQGNPLLMMETSLGSITLELFRDKAPTSVENFLTYVASGFYDGTIFHRVIRGFMVQGGGFDKNFSQKETRPPIRNEADNGLENQRGTLAMARTADPDSATSQFFINQVNNRTLNRPSPDGYGYTVFGRVVEGMEVVDRIARVKTGFLSGFQDVPLQQIEIISIRRIK